MPDYELLYDNADGETTCVQLCSTDLAAAREEAELYLRGDPGNNTEDHDFGRFRWDDEAALGDEDITEAWIIEVHEELPVSDWVEEIEEWENERREAWKSRCEEERRVREKVQETERRRQEFLIAKKKFHELRGEFEEDPSVSTGSLPNKPTKKRKKKVKRTS